jgi:hypothetical protein
MYTNATRYGVYCPEHGLQFITEGQYTHNVHLEEWICPTENCVLECEFEETLFNVAGKGCNFCKKEVLPRRFFYDEKLEEAYCHEHCMLAGKRKCTTKDCKTRGAYVIILEVNEPGWEKKEFVVPLAFCTSCAAKLDVPMKLNDAIWNFITGEMTAAGAKIPERQRCRIILKPY